MDTTFDFTLVSIDDARRALDEIDLPFEPRPTAARAWHRVPSRPEDVRLLPETAKWLGELPAHVRPGKCAQYYPRIANRMCKLWPSPLFLKDYLQDLVLDKRGGRQGFPHGITHELEAFRHYYETLHPSRTNCVWTGSDTVRR